MKKFYLIALMVVVLLGTSSQSGYAVNGVEVSDKEIQQTYDTGVREWKIDKTKVSYGSFLKMCKKEVLPAYNEYRKIDSKVSFLEYCKADNYEQPFSSKEDEPVTVAAMDHPSKKNGMLRTSARSGYKMKAGDILVCYGSNSSGKFVGHAAIATSANYILEMPGTNYYSKNHNAHHPTKASFFKGHTGKGKYVAVYRITKHPYFADEASTYAYNYMYRKANPDYFISTRVYHKSPSYCSKYVYLPYYWGAKKSSVTYYKSNAHVVTPHGLVGNFKGTFKPSYMYKITKY